MVLLVYILGVSSLLFFMVSFLEEARCFVRDAGRSYDAYVGLEFTHTALEKVLCHAHWMFVSWPVVFILAAVGIVMHLRSIDASPPKIIIFFIALDMAFVFFSSFVAAGDGHSRLVGG